MNTTIILTIITLCLFFSSTSQAADSTADLLFYAPFEESTEAIAAQGSAKPHSQRGSFEFAKGAFGLGLRTGAPQSFLMYSAQGNVNSEEGTVCFWLQNDWEPNDGMFHMFWSVITKGRLNLYKYGGGSNPLIFLVQGRDQANEHFTTLSAPIADWQAGDKHHLAATWAPGMLQLFVNGEKVKDLGDPKISLPDTGGGGVFFIGDYDHPSYGSQSGMSGKADTLIRDFRIYEKALGDKQIAELAGVKKK